MPLLVYAMLSFASLPLLSPLADYIFAALSPVFAAVIDTSLMPE